MNDISRDAVLVSDIENIPAENANGWHDFWIDPPKKEGRYLFAYSYDELRSTHLSLEILKYVHEEIHDFYGRNLVPEAYHIFWRECPELPIKPGEWVEAVFA